MSRIAMRGQHILQNMCFLTVCKHNARLRRRTNKMARGTDEDVFLEDNDNISPADPGVWMPSSMEGTAESRQVGAKEFQEVLRGETWYFSERPTYFTAVRNLQGFIEYKLDNESEAEDFFVEVLDHDPVNINALANIDTYITRATPGG